MDDWREVMDTNLTGAFLCSKEASKEFCKRGVIKERSAAAGKIIFISSVHNKIPWA
jgi:glucose 1-dehydrogenase